MPSATIPRGITPTTANERGWGALRLTTTGRKSGHERSVIIGYLEDGPDLVALAMNGWGEGHPSWWLNLQAHPEAVVRLAGQHPRRMLSLAARLLGAIAASRPARPGRFAVSVVTYGPGRGCGRCRSWWL